MIGLPTQTLYLIAYDISSPRVERQLVKLLEKSGLRYQLSLFACMLTPTDVCHVEQEIRSLYRSSIASNPKTKARDKRVGFRVTLFPLCLTCASKRVEIGEGFAWVDGNVIL